jgi:hypothetical protein
MGRQTTENAKTLRASLIANETLYPDPPAADRSCLMSAADTALLLFKASPAHAGSFALSMHERAAWDFDTTLVEHWTGVVTELSHLGRALRLAG